MRVKEYLEKYPGYAPLSMSVRGAMIGRLTDAIRESVNKIHLQGPRGINRQARDIRMDLAQELFKRVVTSYNQLTDGELWAIDRWVVLHNAEGLDEFIREKYGEQLELL